MSLIGIEAGQEEEGPGWSKFDALGLPVTLKRNPFVAKIRVWWFKGRRYVFVACNYKYMGKRP